MSDTISMNNTKTEILEHLEELSVEADENLTKAELLELLVPADDDKLEEAEPTPPPAILGDDTVTIRGGNAGSRRIPRSQYLREQEEAAENGEDSEE